MTQQSLITRLKAVEEALDHSMPNVIGDIAYHTAKHNAALSDLCELIKEVKEQTPDGEWITVGNKLYFALGEKPAAAEQQLAKEKKE